LVSVVASSTIFGRIPASTTGGSLLCPGAARLEDLDTMEMIHVMKGHPESIRWDDTLETAGQMMEAGGFRRLPVTRNGEII